ncbi:MAG: hypothetical protein R3C56_31605 [Pirellulaceae bacterium]
MNNDNDLPVLTTDLPQPLPEFNSTGSASSILSPSSPLRPSTETSGNKLSSGMIIALTIAIAVPYPAARCHPRLPSSTVRGLGS